MIGGRERRAGGAGAALSTVAGALAAKLEDRAERGGFEVSTIVATLAAIAPDLMREVATLRSRPSRRRRLNR
jgi:hypothetical protein